MRSAVAAAAAVSPAFTSTITQSASGASSAAKAFGWKPCPPTSTPAFRRAAPAASRAISATGTMPPRRAAKCRPRAPGPRIASGKRSISAPAPVPARVAGRFGADGAVREEGGGFIEVEIL